MADLKSYSCAKCGGVLFFDSDQEFFDCPFCGTKFNAVDFHGDQILDHAKDCLNNMSFDAAKDKFLTVLDNDPENFDALLGIVLCELNIISTDELKDHNLLEKSNLISAKKALTIAKRSLPKNEADYFDKIMVLIRLHEKIIKYENEKKELLSSDAAKNSINSKLLEEHRKDRSRDRGEFVGRWWLVVLFMPLLALGELIRSPWIGVLLLIGLIAVRVFDVVSVINKDKAEDEKFNPALKLENTLEHKISSCAREYVLEYKRLEGLYPEKHDARKASDESVKNISFNSADIDADEVINCSKCAAKLFIDKEKRVYQCDHCGVAYGVSLFFGLPMEKALNSINTGHYADARKRFDSILMARPSDFEALLGRVLCEGKWTKISDIDLSDDLSSSEIQEINNSLAEALRRASDDDRPYFEELKKLIFVYEDNVSNSEMIDEVNAQIDRFDIRTEIYAEAFHGIHFREKREAERNEILKKAHPYQINRKKYAAEFSSLRRAIINMRSDSVLCK